MVYFEKVLDSNELAEKFIEEYRQNFHPAGYGTFCRKVTQPDGKVLVKVSRGDSCD
jgi:hypothetical protein